MLRKNIPDFQIYLEEMMEKALMELRKDTSYMEFSLRRSDLEKATDKILETLPQESKKTINKYIEEKDLNNALETEHLYIAGHRDCIALLKGIGVL